MSDLSPYPRDNDPTAPEAMMWAMSRLLFFVVTYVRNVATDETFSRHELHDLMDAIHNIPDWMFRWDERHQPDELQWFLRTYENKWPNGVKLSQMFDSFYWEGSHPSWSDPDKHATETVSISPTLGEQYEFSLSYWVVDGKFVGMVRSRSGDIRIHSMRADSFDELKQMAISNFSYLASNDV